MELGGGGGASNPDTEASQWALYPTSKGGASSYSVAQGFSKGGTWTTYISISSRSFNTNADSWAPPQMESESLRAGLKKVYILKKLFRRSWCKFENPCWRRTTVCTWPPLSTPASPAKARTWEQRWGNFTFRWMIMYPSFDVTPVCCGERGRGREEYNVCLLPRPQESSFRWSWLAFLASASSWQYSSGFSEGRRGELVLL